MGELHECGLGALVLRGERFDISQRGRLFLARYVKLAAQYLWNCPGGKLNPLFDEQHTSLYGPDGKQLRESPDATCAREFLEETNLHVKVVDYLYTTERPGTGNKNVYRIHMYLCELVGDYNVILDPKEFDMYGLFNAAEASHLPKTDHVTDTLIPTLIARKLIS